MSYMWVRLHAGAGCLRAATSFVGNSIEMFARATDEELISEMTKRFYWVEKKPLEFWIKRGYCPEKKPEEFVKEE
jgi:hypothetical protein